MSSWPRFRDAPTPRRQGPASPSLHLPRPGLVLGAQQGCGEAEPPGAVWEQTGVPRSLPQRPPAPAPAPWDLPGKAWTQAPCFPLARALGAPCAFHACCILFGTARGSLQNPHLGSPWGWRASRICWAQHPDRAGAPGSFQFHQLLPVLVLEASRKAMSGPQRLKFHQVASKQKWIYMGNQLAALVNGSNIDPTCN